MKRYRRGDRRISRELATVRAAWVGQKAMQHDLQLGVGHIEQRILRAHLRWVSKKSLDLGNDELRNSIHARRGQPRVALVRVGREPSAQCDIGRSIFLRAKLSLHGAAEATAYKGDDQRTNNAGAKFHMRGKTRNS